MDELDLEVVKEDEVDSVVTDVADLEVDAVALVENVVNVENAVSVVVAVEPAEDSANVNLTDNPDLTRGTIIICVRGIGIFRSSTLLDFYCLFLNELVE